MRLFWGILGLLLLTLPVHADEVDYTLSVVNAPEIGDFSWEIQTDGFIQPVPPPVYQCIEFCQESSEHQVLECVQFCGDTNFFDTFIAESAPSNGGGCGISKVFLVPDYALTTFFSPLCDGKFDSETGGGLPDPGIFGTWTSQGTNPDGTENFTTLTIRNASGAAVPEPETLAMLWIGLIGLALVKLAPRGKRPFVKFKASLSTVFAIAILLVPTASRAQDARPKVFIEAPETIVATNTFFSTSVSKTSMEGWYISRWAKDCPQIGITDKKESADYVVDVSSGVSVFNKDGDLIFTHKEWQPRNAVKDACAAIRGPLAKH